MRILHIDPDDIDNPLSGGGPVRTFEIYRRLAARHDITVLTPTFPGSTPEVVRDGIRYVRLGRKVGDHNSSHHITFFFALAAAVRRYASDLLVEDFMPPASATYVPLIARAPLIASVQWFFAEEWSRRYRLPFYLGERYGVKQYRHFIVLTQDMKALIQSRNRHANCEVIPNAVSEDLFAVPPHCGDFILYVGRIDFDQKGVDLLLDAYAALPVAERLPLILAGHGFQGDRLAAQIAKLALQDWVRPVGKVGPEQRAALLAGCRFACVPSRSETFGMVILEACAAGKPVVLFDQAPMNEVAPPECARAAPFDAADYARHMRNLLREDDAALLRRGEACRKWARRFAWDALAAQQENFYRSVLEAERHRGVCREVAD
jgi:glycosyltransferase involved in cell wall biosynthesis